MDATLATHLLLQQTIDHTMARRLGLRLERGRGNRHTRRKYKSDQHVSREDGRIDELEMGFFRSRSAHGVMMCVQMRIIADDEGGGGESGCKL